MRSTISNIFDEKFLVNFKIDNLSISVADMLLIDYVLAFDKPKNDYDREMFEKAHEDFHIPESPEATRHHVEVDDDRVLICSQRYRSPILYENVAQLTSTEDRDALGNFFALSPILKEGFDLTTFDHDQHCDLGTTFNLFGSPDGCGLNYGPQQSSLNTTYCNKKISLNQSQSPSIYHENIVVNDPFHVHMVSKVSLNPSDSVKRKYKEKAYMPDCNTGKNKRSEILQTLQKKSGKMKQTTVTFYYDSDDEINENNSDFNLSEEESVQIMSKDSRSKSKQQCHYGNVRNALGFKTKTKMKMGMGTGMKMKSAANKRNLSLSPSSRSAHSYESISLPPATITPTSTSTTTNHKLQRWMTNVSIIT